MRIKTKEYCVKEKDLKSVIESFIDDNSLFLPINAIDIMNEKVKKVRFDKKTQIKFFLPKTLLGIPIVMDNIEDNKHYRIDYMGNSPLFTITIPFKELKKCKDISELNINNVSIIDRSVNIVVYRKKMNKPHKVYYVNAS